MNLHQLHTAVWNAAGRGSGTDPASSQRGWFDGNLRAQICVLQANREREAFREAIGTQ